MCNAFLSSQQDVLTGPCQAGARASFVQDAEQQQKKARERERERQNKQCRKEVDEASSPSLFLSLSLLISLPPPASFYSALIRPPSWLQTKPYAHLMSLQLWMNYASPTSMSGRGVARPPGHRALARNSGQSPSRHKDTGGDEPLGLEAVGGGGRAEDDPSGRTIRACS